MKQPIAMTKLTKCEHNKRIGACSECYKKQVLDTQKTINGALVGAMVPGVLLYWYYNDK